MGNLHAQHRQFCKAKRRIELGVEKPTDKELVTQLAKILGYKKVVL